jgi:hypothetical protein
MQNNTGYRNFVSSAALTKGTRVMLDANGNVIAADADDSKHIGVVERDCNSGEAVAIKLHNASGTFEVIANGSVTVGALLYPATSGKVSSTQSANKHPLYRALHAVSTDDFVEAVAINGKTQA